MVAAPGGPHIQAAGGGGLAHPGDRPVDGDPLVAVVGGRVAELDRFGHIAGLQPDPTVSRPAHRAGQHRPVGLDGFDGPGFPVGHIGGRIVAAGHDPVPGPDPDPVPARRHPDIVDQPRRYP